MADPQVDVTPIADGVPLNAVELRQAVAHRRAVTLDTSAVGVERVDVEEYLDWIPPYLFYFLVPRDNRFDVLRPARSGGRLLLVPRGAPTPRVFQRRWPIEDATPTHSLPDFYRAPF